MITMLDCIRRVPRLLEDILSGRDAAMAEALRLCPPDALDEICLIGSGSSHTAACTAQYLMESASGVRVRVMLPNEFLYARTVRNPRALHVFISQTGTSSALLEALDVSARCALHTAALCEKADTPAARKADAFIPMGCGHEEYGIRTIGYSTSVMSLMMLGMAIGRARGHLSPGDAAALDEQARAAIGHIPEVIERALCWMDTSRRRIMRSRFIAFTGVGALYGVGMEAAVKMWEAPQYPSAAYELDEGMHGPNYGYTDDDAVILLSDGAPGSGKGLALARYMKNEHQNGYIFGLNTLDDKDLAFTPRGGAFRCLEFAAAVQVFMYRLAVDGGRDFSILGIHAKMNSYFNAHAEAEPKEVKASHGAENEPHDH